jgi:hypothetical protein
MNRCMALGRIGRDRVPGTVMIMTASAVEQRESTKIGAEQ